MTSQATKLPVGAKRARSRLPLEMLLLGLAYLGFVSLGLPDAVLGVAWPSVREVFALTQGGLGLILIALAAGFFVSSTLAGRLLQRLGVGKLLAVRAPGSSRWPSRATPWRPPGPCSSPVPSCSASALAPSTPASTPTPPATSRPGT
jgi:MFS family permease